MAYLMVGFLDSWGYFHQREQMWRWGLAAADAVGDPAIRGLAHSGLGLSYIRMRRFDEGLREMHRVIELMQLAGDKRGEGHAHNSIAVVHTKQRQV